MNKHRYSDVNNIKLKRRSEVDSNHSMIFCEVQPNRSAIRPLIYDTNLVIIAVYRLHNSCTIREKLFVF